MLRRLWLEWGSQESQGKFGAESFDYFRTAPSLLDVGIYHEFKYIPTSLPVHQLTRYHLDAPWLTHQGILKLAKNLVEAHIDIDFDDEPWPESGVKIDLPCLRASSCPIRTSWITL
jgi:hypothetical protein